MSVQSRVKVFESLNNNGPASSTTVDLKDWNVLDDPPLINFDSESPPLPSRNVPGSPVRSAKSGSLEVQQHTYPPARRGGHAPASSISSFHSVSLSDDDRSTTAETADSHLTGFSENASQTSLDDSSFENVSTTESVSAAPSSTKQLTVDWEKQISLNTPYKPRPPKLPQRPEVKSPPPVGTSGRNGRRSPSIPSTSSDFLKNKPESSASSTYSSSSTVILSPSSPVKRAPPPIHSSVSGSWTLTPPNRTSTLPSPSSPPPLSNPPYHPYLKRSASNSSFNSISKQKPVPPPPPLPKSKPQNLVGNTNLRHTSSQASTASIFRPTPVPSTARRRYENTFDENVKQARRAKRERMETRALERNTLSFGNEEKPVLLSPEEARKTRQAAGWRGVSIDLTTNENDKEKGKEKGKEKADEDINRDDDGPVGPQERLEAYVVKIVWSQSRLGKERLKDIWAECDPTQSGSLDKASFVTGMWRIDEELRKAQRDPTKYMTVPPIVRPPSHPPSLKPKPQPKQPASPNPSYPPSLPVRPPPRPISPRSQSPTSSTSSFVSLGGSSLSSGPTSLSVSPSPSSTLGSYVTVGRVNANGGVGSVNSGMGSGTRRKPPPIPVALPNSTQ